MTIWPGNKMKRQVKNEMEKGLVQLQTKELAFNKEVKG